MGWLRTGWVAAIIGAVVALFMYGMYMLTSPIAMGIGILATFAYIAVMVLLIRLLPIWPKMERTKTWVMLSLLWGGGMSLLLVLPVSSAMVEGAAAWWPEATMSFGGAYAEEPIKALGVVIIVMAFSGLNRPWHAMATGALVGLGFEAVENAMYGVVMGLMHPDSDAAGALEMWGLRLLLGPFLHIIWTAMAGWGIGQALFTTRGLWPALGWLFVAFALHFGWNYQADPVWAAMALTSVVQYPLIVVLVVVASRRARRDDTYHVTAGLITAPEYSSPKDSTDQSAQSLHK